MSHHIDPFPGTATVIRLEDFKKEKEAREQERQHREKKEKNFFHRKSGFKTWRSFSFQSVAISLCALAAGCVLWQVEFLDKKIKEALRKEGAAFQARRLPKRLQPIQGSDRLGWILSWESLRSSALPQILIYKHTEQGYNLVGKFKLEEFRKLLNNDSLKKKLNQLPFPQQEPSRMDDVQHSFRRDILEKTGRQN